MVQPEESPGVIGVSVAAKSDIHRGGMSCFQGRDARQATVKENAVRPEIEQETDALPSLASSIRQAGKSYARKVRNAIRATLHLQ